MSRIDRLVRAVGPVLADDESLLASVIGRVTEGRAHAALVATDRQLLVVRERLTGRPVVEGHPYGDVTGFSRQDRPGAIAVDVVTSGGRVSLDRIPDDPPSRVALQLIARRIEAGTRRQLTAAAGGSEAALLRPMVRIVT